MLPAREPAQLQQLNQVGTRLSIVAKRWIFLGVAGIAVIAFGIRCLRLADPNHYYLYSPDSYFWHWLAQRVMAGEGPPLGSTGINYTIHSGLAYPMAYIAKAASAAFNLSPAESLSLVAKFLPPTLAVIALIIMYIGVSRIWSRRVALFSALVWALMFLPVSITAGGYTDRDGLTALLLLIGVLLFYFLKGYRVYIGKVNVGWLLTGFGVLGVEGLLYLEWGLVGAFLLIVVLLVYAVLKVFLEYVAPLDTVPNARLSISTAARKLEWPALGFIACVNIAGLLLYYHEFAHWLTVLWVALRSSGKPSGGGTAEEMGLTFSDIVAFQFFLIPIALGLYRAWKSKNDAWILFSGWFVVFGVVSLIAWRFLLYSIPAICVIAGLGLGYVWEWRGRGSAQLTRTLVVAVLLILLLASSFISAARLNSQPTQTADKDWQEAMAYLRESTPPDAVVMSQWSPGYWILDLGQREPFVDNGYYGYDVKRLRDVGLVYLATNASDAAQIMAKDGVDYLIFSTDDRDVAEPIMQWAGLEGIRTFPSNSLVMQTLSGDFVSGGGLDVVYQNKKVVILELSISQVQ